MLVGSLLYEGQDRKRSVLLTAQPICCRGGRWGRKTGCCWTLRTGQAARGSQAPFEREGAFITLTGFLNENLKGFVMFLVVVKKFIGVYVKIKDTVFIFSKNFIEQQIH